MLMKVGSSITVQYSYGSFLVSMLTNRQTNRQTKLKTYLLAEVYVSCCLMYAWSFLYGVCIFSLCQHWSVSHTGFPHYYYWKFWDNLIKIHLSPGILLDTNVWPRLCGNVRGLPSHSIFSKTRRGHLDNTTRA